MATQINGNNIQATTRGLVEAWSITEQLNLPPLNQSQVNALGVPAFGTLVYNTTEDMAQIYKQDANQGNPGWTDVGGGGPSVGENSIIRTNGTNIQENLTVGPVANGGVEFTNGFSAGPIQIDSGYTVTIETGASWTMLGDDDLSYAQVVHLTSQHLTSTGTFHFGTTKQTVSYYTSTGDITHDYEISSRVWVNKTGGGNFNIYLNNVPTDSAHAYRLGVMVRSQGGTGFPTGININGQWTDIFWKDNSGAGMGRGYGEVMFDIVNTPNTNQHNFTVFGYERDYGP